MAEPRHTSPLENIPPVAKFVESIEYGTKTIWEHSRRSVEAGDKARQMLKDISKFRSWRARAWWQLKCAGALRATTAKAENGRAWMASLRPLHDVLETKAGKYVVHGLSAIGGAVTFSEQIDKSTATTMTGKAVDGAVAGLVDVGLGKTLAAPIDVGLSAVWKATGIDPKGLTIGENVSTGIRAAVTSVEAGITGDYRGVAAFDEKARSGGYGPPAQALADLGSDIGKDGLGATLAANIAFYWHGCRITH